MQQCHTCRWWDKAYPWIREVTDIGVCQLAGSRDAKPDAPSSLAVAQDAASYQAHLVTRQDFGCVQHEPEGEE